MIGSSNFFIQPIPTPGILDLYVYKHNHVTAQVAWDKHKKMGYLDAKHMEL